MAHKLTKQDVQNHLDTLKKSCPELTDIILYNADARLGEKICLATKSNGGAVYTKTDFLSYSEMNQLLRGYGLKADKRFEK